MPPWPAHRHQACRSAAEQPIVEGLAERATALRDEGAGTLMEMRVVYSSEEAREGAIRTPMAEGRPKPMVPRPPELIQRRGLSNW